MFLKEWPVYLFSRGATIFCVPAVPAVSRVTDTLMRTILCKNLKLCVCVCKSTRPDYKKLGHVLFSDTCHTKTDSSCLFLLFPAAFTTLLEGKHSGCLPWFECTRGQLLQTEHATLRLLGGNQALVVKPSEWNVSDFANLQWVRGHLHDSVKPSHKNLTYTNWETVSIPSKGVFIVAEMFMNCKYFWTMCCKYLLIVLLFFPIAVCMNYRKMIYQYNGTYQFYHFTGNSGTLLHMLWRGF